MLHDVPQCLFVPQEVAEKAAHPPEAQAVTGTEKPAAETKETNEVKAEDWKIAVAGKHGFM